MAEHLYRGLGRALLPESAGREAVTQPPDVQAQPFSQWLEKMFAERYTGAVLIQFGEGIPREVQPLKAETRIPLDIPSRRRP
jgi:hypothetical protein